MVISFVDNGNAGDLGLVPNTIDITNKKNGFTVIFVLMLVSVAIRWQQRRQQTIWKDKTTTRIITLKIQLDILNNNNSNAGQGLMYADGYTMTHVTDTDKGCANYNPT